MIEGKELNLEGFIDCLLSQKYNNLYPNNFFPTEEMANEFISNINSYDDKKIKAILRKFLIQNSTFGKDFHTAKWLSEELKKNKDNIEKILSFEYYRKVISRIKSDKVYVWEGLTWILDLLPDSPKQAINVINSYFNANCQFLPDNCLNALSDSSMIIRAKYIDYKHKKDIFNELSPTDFEKLVGKLYLEIGYNIQLTAKSYDNGIDIIAKREKKSQKQEVLIQCKRYTKSKIGVSEVRNLLGVVTNEKSTKRVLVTSSTFTNEAKKFAEKNPSIELINNSDLVELLNSSFGPYWISKIEKIINDKFELEYFFE